ncbi:hypothetical protein C8R44DRAFT_651224 [Mycena epipterygia]|nr:hypothetical protein C8R44DRAFT_651224 [Mycena epipterygia]
MPKDKKEVKTKEFSHRFEGSTDNYIALLKTILEKHGEEKYNITVKMLYSIKVQLPSVKKGEALDIETYEKYKALVVDIIQGLPQKLTIYADMADIQKRWNRVHISKQGHAEGSDNEDVYGDDPDLYDANGLSDLDRSLARLRGILEKRYQNDHDSGYTYIDPDSGKSHPLSPQMMKGWCRAMYDGEADRENPPKHLGLFNVANRQVALHPTRIAAGVNQPPPTSDLGHLATILTAFLPRVADQPPPRPSTPKQEQEKAKSSQAAIPTPSKLPRFLEYAGQNLGVTSAPTFESRMRIHGYGPDILHLLEDQDLMDIGINKGDVIRLKAGAQSWWNGPEANKKRLHVEMEEGSTSWGSGGPGLFTPVRNQPHTIHTTPPSKKVAFEHRYEDGGALRFYGP